MTSNAERELLESAFRKFKTCIGCGVTLPRSAFNAHPRGHDWLQPRCRDCAKERRRENLMRWGYEHLGYTPRNSRLYLREEQLV